MDFPWRKLTRVQCNELYDDVLKDGDLNAIRQLCLYDLFFLLTRAMRRQDIDRDWLYERVREVEADPDGYLDVWAREHYKSTIITFGLTIQNILQDPEITVGIFSHTRPKAKDFLKQIKMELESNTFLQGLFPDILYANPDREAPTWALDGGIVVKRKSNPAAATVEAWGLVDGMPTGKHFRLMIYDDVVTLESVSTPEQIQKTTDAWALSLSLGVAVGGKIRYIGTYYHTNDTWREIERRSAAKVRRHAVTKDGTETGEPVLWDRATVAKIRRERGPYIFACQYLLKPVSEANQSFKEDWVRYYSGTLELEGMNLYLIVDPANAKKKNNDYTVMMVVGLAADNNYYLIYAIRDRLNLVERTKKLFSLVRTFRPKAVGYEQYGMQADIQHIKYVQNQSNFHFNIVELGGATPKPDRIKRLVPVFENGRMWLPMKLHYRDCEGKYRDFIQEFLEDEYKAFPVGSHDDMLDDMARITDSDLNALFPSLDEQLMSDRGQYEAQLGEHVAKLTNHKYDVLAGVGKN